MPETPDDSLLGTEVQKFELIFYAKDEKAETEFITGAIPILWKELTALAHSVRIRGISFRIRRKI